MAISASRGAYFDRFVQVNESACGLHLCNGGGRFIFLGALAAEVHEGLRRLKIGSFCGLLSRLFGAVVVAGVSLREGALCAGFGALGAEVHEGLGVLKIASPARVVGCDLVWLDFFGAEVHKALGGLVFDGVFVALFFDTPELFTPELFTPELFTPELFTPERFGFGLSLGGGGITREGRREVGVDGLQVEVRAC
jgi:hypothetical protein